MNKNEIVVSSRYNEASIKFRMAWAEYMNHEERVKYEIVNMVTILESDGMPRMKAIRKIINDHKDLPGFSKNSIYRGLPDDMKQTDSRRELQKLQEVTNKRSDFPSGKYESINNTDETTYDSNFVNSLIAENEQLKAENFRLKKDYQELETKYKKLLNKTKSD